MREALDPRELTFSQAQGYEELPQPLKLGELPPEARTHIWNVFYSSISASRESRYGRARNIRILGGVWRKILHSKHVWHDNLPLDEWDDGFALNSNSLRHSLETLPFNEIFDLIQFVLRLPECPRNFIQRMQGVFGFCRLAYVIDANDPPTILPVATDAEGKTIVESLETLRGAGLDGSAAHLKSAAACIGVGDWAGSIRDSIHAVESVARQLDASASTTLGPALTSLEQSGALHPALKEAFIKLYGYTSNEQGIRHALLDRRTADVGMDEAVFMLGACASFASYLWRKYAG